MKIRRGDEQIKENFEDYCRRTRAWAIRIEFGLLHSFAYKSLSYGPALKVLNWFFEKRSITVNKRKRGNKRYQIREEDVSFTYDEAEARGLDHKKFARAIRELHARGFLDILHLGSGLRGNANRYRLSERWRAFGTDSFEHVPFPENRDWQHRFSVELDGREVHRHVSRNAETGKWTRRSKGNSQRPKYAVVQRPISDAVNDDRWQISAVGNADFNENTTADIPSIFRSTMGYRHSKERPDGHGDDPFRAVAAPSRTMLPPARWRSPRSELRENVKEILRQRPDSRVSNSSFVRSIVDQIEMTCSGNLLRQRVVFHGKDLDDWTIDLMMAITGIKGAVN